MLALAREKACIFAGRYTVRRRRPRLIPTQVATLEAATVIRPLETPVVAGQVA